MENCQGNLGFGEKKVMPTVTSYDPFMTLFITFLTLILTVSFIAEVPILLNLLFTNALLHDYIHIFQWQHA